MFSLERFLDPLFRPPVVLSVVAAALKYAATVVILNEPLLFTRSDYIRWREATGAGAARRQLLFLVAQLTFLGLAVSTLWLDFGVILEGFPRLSMLQRFHLVAMVLAFSPNTVAAVAGAFITEVSDRWLDTSDVQPGSAKGLFRASDLVTKAFGGLLGLFYLLPLVLTSVVYGSVGFFALGYALAWDLLLLPWRLVSGDLQSIEVAVPITCAVGLAHALNLGLIVGQVKLFEKRYPELVQQITKDGTRVNQLKVKIPKRMPMPAAAILGRVRELPHLKAARCDTELNDGIPGDRCLLGADPPDEVPVNEPLALAPSADNLEAAPRAGSTERCLLNDEMLASLAYVKVTLCMIVPLLQVAVVIAAKVYLGDGLWDASSKAFSERTWTHYVGHAQESGMRAAVPLLWYYL